VRNGDGKLAGMKAVLPAPGGVGCWKGGQARAARLRRVPPRCCSAIIHRVLCAGTTACHRRRLPNGVSCCPNREDQPKCAGTHYGATCTRTAALTGAFDFSSARPRQQARRAGFISARHSLQQPGWRPRTPDAGGPACTHPTALARAPPRRARANTSRPPRSTAQLCGSYTQDATSTHPARPSSQQEKGETATRLLALYIASEGIANGTQDYYHQLPCVGSVERERGMEAAPTEPLPGGEAQKK
jgi:hypothetical protein